MYENLLGFENCIVFTFALLKNELENVSFL